MLIDTSIRDWVLFPLLLLVVLVHFIRAFLMKIISSETRVDSTEMQQKNLVARSQRLRGNGGYITPVGFAMRKEYLSEQLRPPAADGPAAAPANPLDAMQGGMKTQVVAMVTQMGMMMWVQNYFQGFLLVKLPFGLTERFRQLTQAGIGAGSALDISYVSSMSFYMICSAGIPRLLMLVQAGGDPAFDESRMLQMQMGMMGGQQGQPWNAKQAYAAEASALSVSLHHSALVAAEDSLISKGRALLQQRS